ncbi:glycosyltransferase family 2 protein [Halovivax sp.]|uniref:glycosyltransferase n=1 Tax=Halovivax sp. TaxID=1935978 RepID=UPI0025BC06AA|nr:glycosyltransferase [Halovivax sp.]
MPANPSAADRPFVSVVVPVYNDPDGIRATLDSLVDQTYPETASEVIVVDNDSTDETPAVARSVAADHPGLVRLVRETEIQSSYAARNAGVRAASGDVIAFVDADVVADADWLEAGVEAMGERGAEYLGCRVDVPCPEPTFAGRYNAATGFPVRRYVEEGSFAPTCALFVARAVFADVGTFDGGLVSGGDVEFGRRVAASGRKIHYAPEARVEHPARTSLRSLLEKYVRVGGGAVQQRRRYPDRFDPRPLYDPVLYLPPHPLRFHRNFGAEWDRLRRTEKLGLYAVGALVKFAETGGRLAERFGVGSAPAEGIDRLGPAATGGRAERVAEFDPAADAQLAGESAGAEPTTEFESMTDAERAANATEPSD